MSGERPTPTDHRRLLLGLGAVCLAVAAAVTWWQGNTEIGSVLLRADILLAAVWLAYPSLRSIRWGVVLAVGGGAILLLTRWRLLAGVVLIFLSLALFWGRISKRGAPPA